jgi:hypothetical protein
LANIAVAALAALIASIGEQSQIVQPSVQLGFAENMARKRNSSDGMLGVRQDPGSSTRTLPDSVLPDWTVSVPIEQSSLSDPLGRRGPEIFQWFFHTGTFSPMHGQGGNCWRYER